MALRETVKLVFNLALQGKKLGAQDVTVPCATGGTARVHGTAATEPVLGSTTVRLTYVLEGCGYRQASTEPAESYALTLTGTLEQDGTIAAQPSSTMALVMRSAAMSFSGTVRDPPVPYEASCPIDIAQNGNHFGGICDRTSGFDFGAQGGPGD